MSGGTLRMPDRRRLPDPDRILESYAESTRITASSQLVRRLHDRVAEERAATPAWRRDATAAWVRHASWLRELLTSAFTRGPVPAVLRVQSLALLLLLVMALGVAVGGAGAVMVTVVDRTERILHDRGRSDLPDPVPTLPALVPVRGASPAPAPSAEPSVTVRRMAQRHPARGRATGRDAVRVHERRQQSRDASTRRRPSAAPLRVWIGPGSCPVRCSH
jgi:hypothetical protein